MSRVYCPSCGGDELKSLFTPCPNSSQGNVLSRVKKPYEYSTVEHVEHRNIATSPFILRVLKTASPGALILANSVGKKGGSLHITRILPYTAKTAVQTQMRLLFDLSEYRLRMNVKQTGGMIQKRRTGHRD